MGNGFLFWYERGWSPQWAVSRIIGLENARFSLVHAKTGPYHCDQLSRGHLGEQVPIDRVTRPRRAGSGAGERVAVRANVLGLPGFFAAKHPELRHGSGFRLGDLVIYNPAAHRARGGRRSKSRSLCLID